MEQGLLFNIYVGFFGSDVLLAPEYLAITLLIAFVVYLVRRRRQSLPGFWRWIMPRDLWLHRSTLLDLELFVLGRLMQVLGLLGRLSLITATSLLTARLLAGEQGQPLIPACLSPFLLSLALWLAGDLARYWLHRAYHRIGMIWPIHAVHHAAEVLTPLTAYRQHPLALLIGVPVVSVVMGLAQGLVLVTFDPQATPLFIAGTNAVLVIANVALANIHHSHIWISYGPILERLFISPAQHQIHHSTDPRHHNRNYGETLALWDWMFGTLHLATGETPAEIRFGLTGKADAGLTSHRLSRNLWDPLRRAFPRRKTSRD